MFCVCVCVCIPASQCGLQQGGDPHAEENGPYELTSGPLIKADTHRLWKEERHRDSSTEARQVVLERKHDRDAVHKWVRTSVQPVWLYPQN